MRASYSLATSEDDSAARIGQITHPMFLILFSIPDGLRRMRATPMLYSNTHSVSSSVLQWLSDICSTVMIMS